MGGGPSGFMTARGAGNLLTTTTWWLGAGFVICAISLTILGNVERSNRSVVDADAVGSIALDTAPSTPTAPVTNPTTPTQPAAPSLDDLEASLPTAGVAPAPPPAQTPAN